MKTTTATTLVLVLAGTAGSITDAQVVACDIPAISTTKLTGTDTMMCTKETEYNFLSALSSASIPSSTQLPKVCTSKDCSSVRSNLATVPVLNCFIVGPGTTLGAYLESITTACSQLPPVVTPPPTTPTPNVTATPPPTTKTPSVTTASPGAEAPTGDTTKTLEETPTPVATPTPVDADTSTPVATPTPINSITDTTTPAPQHTSNNSATSNDLSTVAPVTIISKEYVPGDTPMTLYIVIISVGTVLIGVMILVACFISRKKKRQEGERERRDSNAIYHQVLGMGVYKGIKSEEHHATPASPHTQTSSGGRPSGIVGSRTSTWGAHAGVSFPKSTRDNLNWDEDAIQAIRIPYDQVVCTSLLSQGAYGQVFVGEYRGQTVAVKKLLPARSKEIKEIEFFMAEIKLVSSLEHERIVGFIGVAWNALSDLSLVSEYMAGGDLRSALARFDQEGRPQGFTPEKLQCALHIAHALTYLGSLQPIVLHRDLKSKNIMLSSDFEAKLTDFGTSRAYEAQTLTVGVGSSLWMAPEVMLGGRYTEKADIFSFGVVLSELDTQQLPYAHTVEPQTNHRLPDTAILQMVSLGRLRVSFTRYAHREMVALGHECVAMEPNKRPTAAQALYRIHQVLRRNK